MCFLCMDLGVRLVSEAMGGAVEMERLHEFPWVLHLSELKFQLQANVVPIGLISKGIYGHRALLFKVPRYHTASSIIIIHFICKAPFIAKSNPKASYFKPLWISMMCTITY